MLTSVIGWIGSLKRDAAMRSTYERVASFASSTLASADVIGALMSPSRQKSAGGLGRNWMKSLPRVISIRP
jgi:hypothetical protein